MREERRKENVNGDGKRKSDYERRGGYRREEINRSKENGTNRETKYEEMK